jgi:hypothetical protein
MSGCGIGGGDLSGKVSFKGSPVTDGWVTLNYPNGEHSPVSGLIRPDGTYRIAGCPTGEARVTIRPASNKGKKSNGPKAPSIPTRYTDTGKTDVVCHVSGGAQTFDIDLKP